jgi:phage shock protein A
MSFFGKLWALVRGFFIRAGDDLVSQSPDAIKSTYAAAIQDAKRRYKDMEEAVALLARERERTEETLRSLDREEQELQKKLEGALSAAESEPNNSAHREAGTRYQLRIQEIDGKQATLTQELDAQSRRVEEYKTRLRSFMAEIEQLKREQGEMVADLMSSRQVLVLEDRLKGLAETSVDESIVAIREKVANLKAQAKIASEMSAATGGTQDQTYERIGDQALAANRFDELLKARLEAKAGAKDKEKARDLG